MSSESWQTLGNIVNTAGLAGFAITGANAVLVGYQTHVSPYASLAESERKLERVKSRLQGLSPQQWEEINTQCRTSNTKCLDELQIDLKMLVDTYYRLSKGCEDVTFVERHIPYSIFRQNVRKLDRDTKDLLHDTLTTTVPHLDDIEYDPKNPPVRPSNSESSIAFPTPTIVVDAIPMSRVV